MKKPIRKKRPAPSRAAATDYSGLLLSVSELLESARRASTRAVNAFMTATYWEIGRRLVEVEQSGETRAGYGDELLTRLANDLTAQFGRGFSRFNLGRFRKFYLATPSEQIRATLSLKSPEPQKRSTLSNEFGEITIVQTLSAKSEGAKKRQTLSGKSANTIRSTASSISETPSRIFQRPPGKSFAPTMYIMIFHTSRCAHPYSHCGLTISLPIW